MQQGRPRRTREHVRSPTTVASCQRRLTCCPLPISQVSTLTQLHTLTQQMLWYDDDSPLAALAGTLHTLNLEDCGDDLPPSLAHLT